ncbi:hypothetical protein [Geodermatophilus normandii]|uniref:Uncharacterized protein n=1 Tax=Geodermatophilus normandii TaxID=1137989 RepID=A0A6P0GDI1_9ACTN|nr:hypothetical protein [Geodermatophilus normandii]NEM05177.1 hypothetical protein [Geodermatophilus normandii]
MKDALLLILGAVLGVTMDRAWDASGGRIKRLRSKRRAAKRQNQEDSLRSAIVEAYSASGLGDELYVTKTFHAPVQLPILHDPTLAVMGTLDGAADHFVSVAESRRVELPADMRVIDAMKRAGAELWDGNVLYAKDVSAPPAGPFHIRAGVCNYYAYVTEKETIRRDLTQRKQLKVPSDLRNLRTALATRRGPLTLAGSAICVFESARGPEVAIQRRSSSVVSATGLLGVIPLFGLESNLDGTTRSRFGTLAYNFLKEFMEEFYGIEELTRAASSSKLHPDWIFDIPKANGVVGEMNSRRLRLTVLDVGFDLRDASLTFALLAQFDSPAFLDRLKLDLSPGSESEGRSAAEKPVRFVPLHGAELAAAAMSGEMDSSSIFALDLARVHYGMKG